MCKNRCNSIDVITVWAREYWSVGELAAGVSGMIQTAMPGKRDPCRTAWGNAAGMIDGTLIGKPGDDGLEEIYFLQFKPCPDDSGDPTGEYGDLK